LLYQGGNAAASSSRLSQDAVASQQHGPTKPFVLEEGRGLRVAHHCRAVQPVEIRQDRAGGWPADRSCLRERRKPAHKEWIITVPEIDSRWLVRRIWGVWGFRRRGNTGIFCRAHLLEGPLHLLRDLGVYIYGYYGGFGRAPGPALQILGVVPAINTCVSPICVSCPSAAS
jgi:hypothetical protein